MPDRRGAANRSDWRERVDDLLYAGEEVLLRVGRGPDEIIVTSHRLLAFSPEGDGPNFHAIDRPNVEGVTVEASGRWAFVRIGARILLAGIFAIVVGVVVDFDGLAASVPSAGTDAIGTGAIQGLLDGGRAILAAADGVLFAVGWLLVVAGGAALVAYWVTRRRTVVVAVAGDDDVHLDGDSFGESDLGKIATALERR